MHATEYYLYAAQQRIGELELAAGGGSPPQQRSAQGQGGPQQPGAAGDPGASDPLHAHQPGQPVAGAPAFEEVDRDADGWISRAELAMIEGVGFATADQNQDGTLSREKYEPATEQ